MRIKLHIFKLTIDESVIEVCGSNSFTWVFHQGLQDQFLENWMSTVQSFPVVFNLENLGCRLEWPGKAAKLVEYDS